MPDADDAQEHLDFYVATGCITDDVARGDIEKT